LALGIGAVEVCASTVDLTSGLGSSGMVDGAFFEFTTIQPAGTGVLEPFLRIQAHGVEEGYNTSNPTLPFDEKPGPWTHDLRLADLHRLSMDGSDYFEFVLDINESSGPVGRLFSLDEIKIYTSPVGGQNTTDLGSLGTLRYDLDAAEDSHILLDYTNASGSGETDMRALIPADSFAGASPSDFVFFYSKSGIHHGADGGFEEWSIAPEPGSAGLMLMALTMLLGRRRRRRT
jgi:hypothetical protein